MSSSSLFQVGPTKTDKTCHLGLALQLLGCRASFNESFNFKLGPEMLDTASITIQLMYAQPGYNKGIIGQGTMHFIIPIFTFFFILCTKQKLSHCLFRVLVRVCPSLMDHCIRSELKNYYRVTTARQQNL
jgi:hypothetical protein